MVADVVSTAYRGGVALRAFYAGDAPRFVVGAGSGVGGFGAGRARRRTRRVAMQPARLKPAAAAHGAEHTLDASGRQPSEVRKELHALARSWRFAAALAHLRVQRDAWLASAPPRLSPVRRFPAAGGYTPNPVELRFSNLMAFDATVHGWGCPPEAYPAVLRLIAERRVTLPGCSSTTR